MKQKYNPGLLSILKNKHQFPNNKINIVGIKTQCYNPESRKHEEYSIFWVHQNIIFQIDNIIQTPNYDFEFIKEYKLYNLKNIYPESKFIELEHINIETEKQIEIPKDIFCIQNIDKEKQSDFLKTFDNLLYPHARLILHLNDYYTENAEYFFDLDFVEYGEYFYNYIVNNFPLNKHFLRKSYVRDLENSNIDKAQEKLLKILEMKETDEFDYLNLAYTYKMQENFEKACDFYAKIPLSKKQDEFFYNDYLYCLEMKGDTNTMEKVKKIKKEFFHHE